MADREEHANGSMQVHNSTYTANASTNYKNKRLRSKVWEVFRRVDVDGNVKAECMYCHKCLSGQSTGGTSHLERHIKKCPKRPGANQEQHRDLALESNLSVLVKQKTVEQEISPEEIARMMVSHGQSFSILGQNNYWQFLTHLNPMLKAISHATLEEKLLAIFEEVELKLLEIFYRSCSRVSLSANLSGVYPSKVLCLKAHFIDQDWKIHRKTIKIVLLDLYLEPWERYCMTDVIYGAMKDWNFDKKLLALTTNYDGIDDVISKLQMDSVEGDYSPTEGKLWNLPCMEEPFNYFLLKISPITFKFHCFVARQNFLEYVSKLEIKHPHFLNEDSRYHYCILKSGLLFMEKFPDHRSISSFGKLSPSDEELKVAERFCSLAWIVDDAMKVFSGHDISTSNLYFDSFCKVRKALEEAAYDTDYEGIFKNMQSCLDRCFQESYVWLSIPVILDPRFKFNFSHFEQVFGSDAPYYNSKVKEEFKELFDDYSLRVGKQNGRISNCESFGLETVLESNDPLHNSQATNQMITSELDRYLRDEHIISREGEFDILKWWRNHSGEGQYPILACMAKDILAIPASSTVFFDDYHKRGYSMTKLGRDTIDAIVCTQDWLKLIVGEHDQDGTKQVERSTNYADNRIEVCKKLSTVTVDGNEFVSKAQIQKLCKMIASHGLAFTVLGHDDSWEFFTRLNPIFNMISRITMEQNFLAVFEEEKMKLKELFNRSCSRVFLSAKNYDVQSGRGVMSLRAHFIDQEWQIHRKIVKYYSCELYHDKYVSNIVKETITDWSFDKKFSGLTTTENHLSGVNCPSTKRKLPIYNCCVVELIKKIMDNYMREDIFSIYHEYAESFLRCEQSCSLWHSQKYIEIISQLDLQHPHANSLLWYKVYCTLEVGLRLGTICPAEKSKAADRFCKIARTFYDALKVVAVSDNVTSNLYFHALWSIRTCLQLAKSDTESEELDIEGMSNSLEKYLQESYLSLSIPVVLDPRYKIRSIGKYFEQVFGSNASKYVSQVNNELHELLISYFDVDEQCNGPSNGDIETPVDDTVYLHVYDQHVSTRAGKQSRIELDKYYGDSFVLINGDFEILQWWKDNARVYPTIACVARDILAMPSSTINFEEAFYIGDGSFYNRANFSSKWKLSAKTIEAFQCMQDWTKSNESIPTSTPGDADNDHAFASQRKRKEPSVTSDTHKSKRTGNFPTHYSQTIEEEKIDMTASTTTPKIVPPLLSSLPLDDWVEASNSPPLLSSQQNTSKLTVADSQSEAKSSQSPSASKPHSTPSSSALPRIPAEEIFALDFDSLGEGSSFKSILGRIGVILDNYTADETLQHLGVIKEQVALLSSDHELPEDLKTVLGDICTLDDEVVEAEKRHQLREKVMEKRKMFEEISGVVRHHFENAQSIKKELELLKNALEKAKKEGKEAQAEAKHLMHQITGEEAMLGDEKADEALLDKPRLLLNAARVCIANILDSK